MQSNHVHFFSSSRNVLLTTLKKGSKIASADTKTNVYESVSITIVVDEKCEIRPFVVGSDPASQIRPLIELRFT